MPGTGITTSTIPSMTRIHLRDKAEVGIHLILDGFSAFGCRSTLLYTSQPETISLRAGRLGYSQYHSSITWYRNTSHQMRQADSLIPANHQGPSCTIVNMARQQTTLRLTSPADLQHTVEQLLVAATMPTIANSAMKMEVGRTNMFKRTWWGTVTDQSGPFYKFSVPGNWNPIE